MAKGRKRVASKMKKSGAGVYCVRTKGSSRCMRVMASGQVRFAKASACLARYKKPCKKSSDATNSPRSRPRLRRSR